MAVKKYNSKQVVIVFGGAPLSGLADGDFLEIEYSEDAFTTQIGTDGEGTRSKSNNNSATITVHLMQTSASNDILSALHNIDKKTESGDGISPLLVKDLGGLALHAAETAWVVKEAPAAYGREAKERVWVLGTDSLESFVGGSI